MKFLIKHKILSFFIVIILFMVCNVIFVLTGNSLGKKSLESQAPITALNVKKNFNEQDLVETEEPFRCVTAKNKYEITRVCRIDYKVEVTPSEDIEKNYTTFKQFVDELIEDNWNVGTMTSTYSSKDTFNKLINGDALFADKNGVMNIKAGKNLGNGAQCTLISQYIPPKSHHKTKNGFLNYDLFCSYTVKRLLGIIFME